MFDDIEFMEHIYRYGDIFKTHILGCPCVMISSPEAARTVLVTQANLFKPTYPPSKEKMIGPEALFFQQGAYHSMLKKLVQASFLPSTIKNSVSHVDQIVLKLIPTWANRTINTLEEMKKVHYITYYNYTFKIITLFFKNFYKID
jgi:(+)-abscisic acid 8'-hydroxylase